MPRYKFEPSEAMALYASIMTGAEISQMNLKTFTVEEVVEYHLAMVAIGIVSLSKCNAEECLKLYMLLGDKLADLIKTELENSAGTLAEVQEQLNKDEEIFKQREENFLRRLKTTDWKM